MFTDEASADLYQDIETYRLDPSCENATALRKSAAVTFKREWLSKPGSRFALVGSILGLIDGIAEQHRHHKGLLLIVGLWFMRRNLGPERPGWNDYWMMRWMISHSVESAREIHRRACHLTEWPDVRRSAEWMMKSVMGQDAAFEFAMNNAQLACNECGLGGPYTG